MVPANQVGRGAACPYGLVSAFSAGSCQRLICTPECGSQASVPVLPAGFPSGSVTKTKRHSHPFCIESELKVQKAEGSRGARPACSTPLLAGAGAGCGSAWAHSAAGAGRWSGAPGAASPWLPGAVRPVPGGGVLVIESLLAADGRGPLTAQLYSLNMLVQTEGRERTPAQYRALLAAASFRHVQCRRTGGLYDAILATR